MSVEEYRAKGRWCPFARSRAGDHIQGATVNRIPMKNGEPDPDCLCIASQCMAWVPKEKDRGVCGLVHGSR